MVHAEMPPDVDEMVRALCSADSAARRRAGERLAQLAEQARPAAVDLLRACADPDDNVREWAVAALEEIGAPLARDVAAIGQLIKRREPDVAYWAATLLGRLGETAAPAASALADAVCRHADLAVRQRAAWALGRIGPAAGKPAIDALTQAAGDDDPRLARLARQALDQIQE